MTINKKQTIAIYILLFSTGLLAVLILGGNHPVITLSQGVWDNLTSELLASLAKRLFKLAWKALR